MSKETFTVRPERRYRVTRARVFVALGGVACLAAAALAIATARLSFNTTLSLPVGIYQSETTPRRLLPGMTVVACPPPNLAPLFVERHYVHEGICPGGSERLLKIVAAVAGSTVDVEPAGVWIDGRRLPNSALHATDAEGRPLPLVATGVRILRPGQVWLWTPNPRSLDSRYLGAVSVSAIQSRARLLVPFGAWAYAADLPAEPPWND